MLSEMWTRSRSDATEDPGKSRSVFTHSVGNIVLLQVREIACEGFRRRVGLFWSSPDVRERMLVTKTAATADTTINITAMSESKMIFFLVEDDGLGFTKVASEEVEPPGSEGPNLPYSIVVDVLCFFQFVFVL